MLTCQYVDTVDKCAVFVQLVNLRGLYHVNLSVQEHCKQMCSVFTSCQYHSSEGYIMSTCQYMNTVDKCAVFVQLVNL